MKKANGNFNDDLDHNGNEFKENEYDEYGELTKSNYCFWNPTRMTNALRAQLFFKRLNAYAVFSVLACAVILMPLYLGEGYVRVLERAAAAAVPSLQFWLPRFRLSLFSWPSDLPFPSQVAHALSITFLSIEQL